MHFVQFVQDVVSQSMLFLIFLIFLLTLTENIKIRRKKIRPSPQNFPTCYYYRFVHYSLPSSFSVIFIEPCFGQFSVLQLYFVMVVVSSTFSSAVNHLQFLFRFSTILIFVSVFHLLFLFLVAPFVLSLLNTLQLCLKLSILIASNLFQVSTLYRQLIIV